METKKLEDEERLIVIKPFRSQEPYLWYASKIGEEITVIENRYERMYHAVHDTTGESRGYIVKTDCDIIKELIGRKTPNFPFIVRVMKNSWSPQCWYAKYIGCYFKITESSGGSD